MADHTKIEWTEATWNPVTGCTVHSAGCTNCYAMKLAGTRLAHHPSRAGLTIDTKAGPVWNGQVRFNAEWLTQPLKWKRPRMIFVCAHGDLFHESVPDAWIAQVFNVMADAPQHTFQVLTKRSVRMRKILSGPKDHRLWSPKLWHNSTLPNVWLGVSVEDQRAADERVPDLLATPAAVRWLSCEPLLGPVDLREIAIGPRENSVRVDALTGCEWDELGGRIDGDALDWIVAGGESGQNARPMHPDWARSLRDQCAAAEVPFFFKQWGEWASASEVEGAGQHHHFDDGATVRKVGKKAAGRLLDGVLHDAMPGAR